MGRGICRTVVVYMYEIIWRPVHFRSGGACSIAPRCIIQIAEHSRFHVRCPSLIGTAVLVAGLCGVLWSHGAMEYSYKAYQTNRVVRTEHVCTMQAIVNM